MNSRMDYGHSHEEEGRPGSLVFFPFRYRQNQIFLRETVWVGEQRDFVRGVIADGLLQIILTLPQQGNKTRKEKSLKNCESSLRQWESFSSATNSAGILTFTRVRTFDPLELGEWVFGNRLQLITAPTSNNHGGLWRWQLIHRPWKSGLNSQAQSQFPLEIIMLHALVMVAIDACANQSSNCAAQQRWQQLPPSRNIVY